MVRELERKRQGGTFPETAPAANPVFFRTYSRRTAAGLRESWDEVCDHVDCKKVNAHLVVATYQLGTQTFLLNQWQSI